jgi:hypothetical protein
MSAPVPPPRARRAPDEPGARAWIAAIVAAWVPPVWWIVVLGGLMPFVVPVMLASAVLWFAIARELEAIPALLPRLLAALAAGLLSPPAGVLAASTIGSCACCCVFPVTVPPLFDLMFAQPLLFFPWGVAMGLVAFALVTAGVRDGER